MNLRDIYLYNDADLENVGKYNEKELLEKITNFCDSINIDKIYDLFLSKKIDEAINYCVYLQGLASEIVFSRFVKDFDYILEIFKNEYFELLHYALSKLDMDQQVLQKSLK